MTNADCQILEAMGATYYLDTTTPVPARADLELESLGYPFATK